ncbi:MAG: hypothetical protein CL523_02290 [Actinomycetales bacterium]|nr:MAG: hypothetical protein CL523_02290 [Actinomycetales bacterium]
MTKIAIISGEGSLPKYIGESLIKKNYDIMYLLLSNNNKIFLNENFVNIDILSIKNIFKILESNNIKNIIFAGSIKRPSIKDVGFDFQTFLLAKNLFLEKKGDNDLLISIKKYFESKGYIFFNWTKYCKELFSTETYLSKLKPSKKANLNLTKAKSIYEFYKKLDVGQSIVVQNQLTLGLEAIEGTDQLLQRCFNYKRKGDKGILLKFAKINQSNLIDIPLIGIETIFNLKKYNYEGVYLQKNKCLILDKNKIIEYANKNNLFVSSVDLS